jgi:hypothetical protein
MSDSGIPITATNDMWLPCSTEEIGKVINPTKELERGSTVRMNRMDVISIGLCILMLLLTLPVFPHCVSAYQWIGMTPRNVATTSIRGSDIPDDSALKRYQWFASTCTKLRSDESCKATVDVVVMSRSLGWKTFGLNPNSFMFHLIPQHGIGIADAEAFLLRNDGTSVVPLMSDPDEEGIRVYVPQCLATDKLAVVIRLCSPRAGEPLFNSGQLEDSLRFRVSKGGP